MCPPEENQSVFNMPLKAAQSAVVLRRFMKTCVSLTALQSSHVVSVVHAFGSFSVLGGLAEVGEADGHLVHSWTCPPVLQHTCCPCRPGRGMDQTPWVIRSCDWTKRSVTSSPKRTSEWKRERERHWRTASYFYAICCWACMYAWRCPHSDLYVT